MLKTKEQSAFLLNPPVEGTVKSMAQKTRGMCKNDVQELHLCSLTLFSCSPTPPPPPHPYIRGLHTMDMDEFYFEMVSMGYSEARGKTDS
jgi:hypothetical protein